jgi:magnesium transporter
LIIRGLAVDEIHFKDWFKVLFKEIRIAVIVGVLLAIVNGIRIVIMYHSPILAITLGITLVCTVILSKTIGCVLPLLAKKIGLDPALMAAPLITTLVDTGTIFIYFLIATRVFQI